MLCTICAWESVYPPCNLLVIRSYDHMPVTYATSVSVAQGPCNLQPLAIFLVSFLVNILRWFVLHISLTHGLALLSHYFKSITCVCSVIFSLQRCCIGVLLQTQDVFFR